MALLAGPKRKQKLGFDPNNVNWRNDTSAIGQSLLKKMGWKEGSGLGANEDGRVIPVKASLKMDNRGLGCTPQQADAWIAHQEEFDQILAALNGPENSGDSAAASPASGRDSPVVKEEEGQSRRFYGRYSRGGVKKTRTAEDLDCILGRRKSAKLAKETNSEDCPDKDQKESPEEGDGKDADKSHGFVTVTSTTSVQDYFAQKLKDKKLPPSLSIKKCDEDEKEVEPEEQHKNSFLTSSFSVKDYFAHKMRAKQEKLTANAYSSNDKDFEVEKENVMEADCTLTLHDKEETSDLGEKDVEKEIKTKKKKKKSKSRECSDLVEDDVNRKSLVSCDDEEKPNNKKKRKRTLDNEDSGTDKKKSKLDDDESSDAINENNENGKKKRKKTKSRKDEIVTEKDNTNEAVLSSENRDIKNSHAENMDNGSGNEDLPLSKDEKQKLKKQAKQRNVLQILSGLRVIDNHNQLERIQSVSVGNKDLYDQVMLEMEPKLNAKLAEKANLNKDEKIEKLDKKIMKMKKSIIKKASAVNSKAALELDAVVAGVISETKRKIKENVGIIHDLKENQESKNNDIDWKNEKAILKSVKKSMISVINEAKTKTMEDLDRQFDQFTQRLEKMKHEV